MPHDTQARRMIANVFISTAALLVAALAAIAPDTTTEAAVPGVRTSFGLCRNSAHPDCVIDGDTIVFRGDRIRMVDYDAPEIFSPKCASEEALGHRATSRLLELLNAGRVDARPAGRRDEDRYGRKLRLVLVDGRSVGTILISEGLAWPWEGRRHAWCKG